MANSVKSTSGTWVDGIAPIIDSVTNLYQVVAAKSPVVADTVVVLFALLPFYFGLIWFFGPKNREKKADKKVKESRKANAKPGNGKPKRRNQ